MSNDEPCVVNHVVPFEQWSTVARCLRDSGFDVTPSPVTPGPVMNVAVRGASDAREVAAIVRRFVPNPAPPS